MTIYRGITLEVRYKSQVKDEEGVWQDDDLTGYAFEARIVNAAGETVADVGEKFTVDEEEPQYVWHRMTAAETWDLAAGTHRWDVVAISPDETPRRSFLVPGESITIATPKTPLPE